MQQIIQLAPYMICIASLILKNIILISQERLNYCIKLGTWPVHLGMFYEHLVVDSSSPTRSPEFCSWADFYWIFIAICSLKRLLHSKADAFLSNNYYDSDIAWIELVRTLYIYVLHSCNDSSYTVYHSGTNNGNSIYSKLYFILFFIYALWGWGTA